MQLNTQTITQTHNKDGNKRRHLQCLKLARDMNSFHRAYEKCLQVKRTAGQRQFIEERTQRLTRK